MLEGDRAKISSEMINQLSTISDKLEASLDSIVLFALGTRDACFQSRLHTRMNKVALFHRLVCRLPHNSISGPALCRVKPSRRPVKRQIGL